jgi:hypothetical protein
MRRPLAMSRGQRNSCTFLAAELHGAFVMRKPSHGSFREEPPAKATDALLVALLRVLLVAVIAVGRSWLFLEAVIPARRRDIHAIFTSPSRRHQAGSTVGEG